VDTFKEYVGTMETEFLSMTHINKRYAGVHALRDVDFSIREGEINCLAGTNGSGKSTLVKIICGVEQPDADSHIVIRGEEHHRYSRMDAVHQGIQVIYQDLSLFPNLSVQENISFNELLSGSRHLVSWKKSREIAKKAMQRVGISITLDKKVADLSMADQQLVAISRALTNDVRLLILDEPTTALTKKEVQALLSVIKDLKKHGIATLFISHKLDELIEVADRVTILRDGEKTGTFNGQELDDKKIEYHMTGTNTTYTPYHEKPDQRHTPLLQCRQLSRERNYADIDLTIHHGEIIGITGLLGSGRTELALALFGLNPPSSGECLLDGEPLDLSDVRKVVEMGIAYVPENRLVEGLVLNQPISKNIVMTVLDDNLTGLGLLDDRKLKQKVDQLVKELEIKIPSSESAVKTLSGGNQQRVVLAKWIATNPKLFILDNPTVGIDIAAKTSIHTIIKQLAREGMGIIIISDEIPEVLYNCNRVLVMNRGRIIGSFDSDQTSEDDIQSFIDSHAL